MIARDVVWFMVRFVVEQQLRTSYGALGAALLGLVSLLLITSPGATKKEKPPEEVKRKNVPGVWWVLLLLCLLMAHVQL
ncbi:hypothetical protein [Streptomyces hokutonensis]|uniref:hypothetical protein n=1 Tax=Streptomyces hokutonensis TaxID=1306990 RepID=UPI0037FB1BC5